MAIVYVHRKVTDQSIFYVGIGLTRKRSIHSKHRSGLWKRIALKYGHTVEILHTNLTWGQACVIEKQLIAQYGRLNKGTGTLANMTDGGEGTLGKVISDVQREKMRLLNKGKKLTPEHKAKLIAANTGKKRTAEVRAKIRASNTGKKMSTESKIKMSLARKGKPGNAHSESRRQNTSRIHKGKIVSAETRAKLSAAGMGKPLPQWVRDKMSASKMGNVISAASKIKISAANKGRKRTPEQCQNMRDGRQRKKLLAVG